jgi:TIR domain
MKVFLSYRRSDSAKDVDRIEKTLRARLAAVEIFRDVASIDSGERWFDKIKAAIASCDLMLVIIGPTWLTVATHGVRRLDDPTDVVRMEIAWGLEQRTQLIPVLVDGASFPPQAALPPDIQNLVWTTAHVIGKRTVKKDLTALLQRMGSLLHVRVQEKASEKGRSAADVLIRKVDELAKRDPEARDFEAYWRWFLEAKDLLQAASTGTEVAEELRNLEELLADARGDDDAGRELAMTEAQLVIEHIRDLYSTEEERAADTTSSEHIARGPIVLPGVSSFDPVGSWEVEIRDAMAAPGTSKPLRFAIDQKGLVTGTWQVAGVARRVDGVCRQRLWQPPDDGRRWVGGKPTRLVGLVLELELEGLGPRVLNIPIDEEFGRGYRGREKNDRTFLLRRVS